MKRTRRRVPMHIFRRTNAWVTTNALKLVVARSKRRPHTLGVPVLCLITGVPLPSELKPGTGTTRHLDLCQHHCAPICSVLHLRLASLLSCLCLFSNVSCRLMPIIVIWIGVTLLLSISVSVSISIHLSLFLSLSLSTTLDSRFRLQLARAPWHTNHRC